MKQEAPFDARNVTSSASNLNACPELPGADLSAEKMPGHWLLARLGKRVLRPGGMGMTQALIRGLSITSSDRVVEFAPGLGTTARVILDLGPRQYTGVERDPKAVAWAGKNLPRLPNIGVAVGSADATTLLDGCASVVIGEAMLTMNTPEQKRRIIAEAARLLAPGGRYGVHELCIVPDDLQPAQVRKIDEDLSSAIHVGARPLRGREWIELVESCGFRVILTAYAPMHLLRPRRLIEDEGMAGALRIVKNALLDPSALRRVFEMRRVFERYERNLRAISLVARKI